MVMTRTQINAKSENKRGIKVKGFKLHIDDIARIEQLAERLGLSQGKTIMKAISLLEQQSA
ncbi:hypothetical protein A4G19_10560 [Pasteurellaceae bacterium Macca]|nr:hypothetical protein [Pasteurellaceae bacterium Macca]MCK3656165.1 hypothetical protein [Pasteurellaceae bacterium Macca]